MHTPLSAVLVSALWTLTGGGDCPQFRGPLGNGVLAGTLPSGWSETEHVAWKTPLPGQGWSQPVVVGDTVYVTAAVGEGLEAPMGMAAGVADPRTMKPGQPPEITVDWRVIALDLATGKERWSASAAKGKPAFPIHPTNTYATETAVADAQGVYAFFGAVGTLAAFDPAGKALWKVELGAHPVAQGYGTSASPAIHAGRIFVQCFNSDEALLACFDARTGKEVWRVNHDQPATSWGSPLVWHNAERVEVVVASERLITSHDPATGKELWRVEGVVGPSMCSFAADEERLYFGQRSPMANPPLYALEAGGEGDLSPEKGSNELMGQVWMQKSASPGLPSPVAADGLLYIATENLLTCRDAGTGEELYKERAGDLSLIAASPLLIGDTLLLVDEEGRALLVRVGPEFEVVGRGKLDDLFWATPGFADGALLLRGGKHLYCIRG